MTRVLIVDDSPTETRRMSEVLKKEGYEVIAAKSGEDGIVLAQKEAPDVILMDIVMPGMNGFQATRQLTKSAETGDIPVIIVSSKDQSTDKMWGKRQGAKGYLTKPVKEKELLSTVKQVLAS